MKKSLFIAFAAALVFNVASAQNKANITLNTGDVESYNTTELQRIDIVDNGITVVPTNGDPVQYSGNIARLSFLKNSAGKVQLIDAAGWFETAYVKWTNLDQADAYNVYVRKEDAADYTKLDNELVRNYGDYGRADMPGLVAGNYCLKVVPVSNGAELSEMASETPMLNVKAHNRGGFAHFNWAEGVGAYKNDGSLKDGAKVIYVNANNAKTVSTDVMYDKKLTTFSGMQAIITAYQKGTDTTPIAFRIIGRVTKNDMDALGSSSEGLQVKGKRSYSTLNITIEGIGDDACFHGFGILMRNATSVEVRNLGFLWFMDDGISIDTDNSHLWIHNCDFFYGQKGGDSDQAKGDGSLDCKGDSQYSTFSYNRFWDAGKSNLCGLGTESENWLTYHHNWYDHSDSRHPRVRGMSVHIYNNYYDGVAKYGAGATLGSDLFVESNYFRNTQHPILTSKQGSDIIDDSDGSGTFSGEAGGVVKAYGNIMCGKYYFRPWSESNTQDYDAWVAPSRDAQVPSNVAAKSGGATYSNWDTDPSKIYSYEAEDAADVPASVKGFYGAGRCNHGDIRWTFNNNTQDANYEVILALSNTIRDYDSWLVGNYTGDTKIGNGGVGFTNPGGDSSEGDEFPNGNYNAAEGSNPGGETGGDEPTTPEEPFITSADGNGYFRFDESSVDQVAQWVADGVFVGGTHDPAYAKATYWDGVGSYQIAIDTEMVIKCPSIRSFKIHLLRTGSFAGKVLISTDGKNYTEVASITGSKGAREFDWSAALRSSKETYVKIQNTATGGLNIIGLYITK